MGPRKNDQQTRAHCGSSPAGRYVNFFHDSKGRLIRRMHKGDKLTDKSMTPFDVFQMIKLRAKAAALPYSTCCHTFRATGITTYLQNGGTLEPAPTIPPDHPALSATPSETVAPP